MISARSWSSLLVVAVLAVIGTVLGFTAGTKYLDSSQNLQARVVELETFSAGGGRREYLRAGWYEAETWGTWSSGPRAEVVWPLRALPASDLRMRITGRIFPAFAEIPQTVSVIVNQAKVTVLERDVDGELPDSTFVVPLEVAKRKTPMEIVFEIANPIAPSTVTNSTDNRKLGLGVEQISLIYKTD